jgi:hypothetical protein
MREVETNMAKERADLARLRTDLQRQQIEIDRALEITGWDPLLKQKLVSFRRRPDSKGSPPTLERPQETAAAIAAPVAAKKTSSGIFRRLFGGT